MLTVGVQEAMAVALLGTVDPGDDVLVPDPGFPAYANLVRAAGGRPVSYPLTADFGLDPDAVEACATEDTRVIVLNSPSNPTGGVIGREALARLTRWCAERDILWVSDEIYEDFVWEGEHVSPREVAPEGAAGIVLGGLSKMCAMMGWRLGWLVSSVPVVEGLKPLHQHLVTCAPTLAQHAAIAALGTHESIVADIRAEFAVRRGVLLDILGEMSTMKMAAPAGAFYAFPDVSDWAEAFGGSLALCQALLAEEDVVTIPGAGFGRLGEGHLRIAYTIDAEQLTDALERVVRFLDRHKP
jgi:aspartate aminotransferase